MLKKIENITPKLIYLFLITTIMVTTFSISKYESAIVGFSETTVASFIINASGNGSKNLEIDCNTSKPTTSYDIVVTNKKNDTISQVAIKYNIIIELSSVLPSGMQISLSTGDKIITQNGGKSTYTFENIGDFPVSIEKNNIHTISLTGSQNVATEFDGTMTLYVDAYQID